MLKHIRVKHAHVLEEQVNMVSHPPLHIQGMASTAVIHSAFDHAGAFAVVSAMTPVWPL